MNGGGTIVEVVDLNNDAGKMQYRRGMAHKQKGKTERMTRIGEEGYVASRAAWKYACR
jgi:hypothetical protein